MPSEIERAINDYRMRILAQEAAQMREMAQRWLQVENTLISYVTALTYEIAELRNAGKKIGQAKIEKLDSYKNMLVQSKEEIRKYNAWAADLIANRQIAMTALGIEGAADTIRAAYFNAGKVGAYFDLLPVEAVETMIGYAGDGTPLSKLLQSKYVETAMDISAELIKSTALGINPRDTARSMLDMMAGNLQHALVVARTEQLRAYREASRQQMIASGVVDGYIRRCALNPLTCVACLALDGTEYPTDTLMEVHPNDRCFMQPKVKDLKPIEQMSGEAWFGQQTEDVQRGILGNSYFDAWKSGKFEFRQLARTTEHDVWGATVRVTPLSELIPTGRDGQ